MGTSCRNNDREHWLVHFDPIQKSRFRCIAGRCPMSENSTRRLAAVPDSGGRFAGVRRMGIETTHGHATALRVTRTPPGHRCHQTLRRLRRLRREIVEDYPDHVVGPDRHDSRVARHAFASRVGETARIARVHCGRSRGPFPQRPRAMEERSSKDRLRYLAEALARRRRYPPALRLHGVAHREIKRPQPSLGSFDLVTP
jgi:hypothetical protein